MMSKVLRMVLTWMLAVALPLQGYAVHAMSCGPAHHHPAAAVAEVQNHHHGGDVVEHHAAATDQAVAADGNAAPDGKSVHASKCSVCASCCSAAVIMTTAFNFDPVPVMPVIVATIPVAHDGILSGGLERPPRLLLS